MKWGRALQEDSICLRPQFEHGIYQSSSSSYHTSAKLTSLRSDREQHRNRYSLPINISFGKLVDVFQSLIECPTWSRDEAPAVRGGLPYCKTRSSVNLYMLGVNLLVVLQRENKY